MMHDAIIVGGSFAGLSAAMYLARARRNVCIVDAGAPRNRFAEHSHGFFGHDGSAPGAMLDIGRSQVAAYPTVSFVSGKVDAAQSATDGAGFAVTLDNGERLTARTLVLAFGISDELPVIEGLSPRWGRTVLHCPYCHGFEFSGQRLGVLYASPLSVHQAMLIAEWGPTTLYLNGHALDEVARQQLAARNVAVVEVPVRRLRGEGTGLEAIELEDGSLSAVNALYIGARTHLNSPIADQIGCAMEEGMVGPFIKTDEWKQTSVPGVWAAGDIARPMHSVTWASADGVTAGVAVHRSLVFPA